MSARPQNALFLTVEGCDGTGKTTLVRGLVDALRTEGHDVTATREPGGSRGAEEIRALIVAGEADRWDAMTETLLFTAARRDHVQRTILPALARGAVVICDRFIDSTRVYQGRKGVDRDTIDRLHTEFVGLDPAITLLLDAPAEVGLARAEERGGEARFEALGLDYHAAVREAFRDIADAAPSRVTRLNATDTPQAVLAAAVAAVRARLA